MKTESQGTPGTNKPRVAATHDFTAKLRQPSLFPTVESYVDWQKSLRKAKAQGTTLPPMPGHAPISINLDLTTACNYRCDHCIDWDVLNSPIKYDFQGLLNSLGTLADKGLKSVILIGGGEPTLHPGFQECVAFLKDRGLQVSVVTNGSRNDKIYEIIDLLDDKDWIRLSLDSGSNETFSAMHKPVRADLSLDEICSWIPKLREKNPKPLIGYSYIIVWEGAEREEGVKIVENIDEIYLATQRAKEAGFSYISLKPFLTRQENGSEVMDPQAAAHLESCIQRIREQVDKARELQTENFRVVESINLLVLEKGNWKDFTKQPKVCHMQALRQVLSPMGLYNCPAHRGVPKAKIAGSDAFRGEQGFGRSMDQTAEILERFDASKECSEVTCLYHDVNWWIENAIEGRLDLSEDGPGEEKRDWFL